MTFYNRYFVAPLYHNTFHQLALITLHVSKRLKNLHHPFALYRQIDDDDADDLVDAAASEAVADPPRRPTIHSVGRVQRSDVLVGRKRLL